MRGSLSVSPEVRVKSINYSQYLVFRVQGARYALRLDQVEEVAECGPVTPVPLMPSFVLGIINVRGCVVPIIDLAARLKLPSRPRGKRASLVIVEALFESHSYRIGLLVDAVETLLDVHTDDIATAPSFGSAIRRDFIIGILQGDSANAIALDLQRLVALDELQPTPRALAP